MRGAVLSCAAPFARPQASKPQPAGFGFGSDSDGYRADGAEGAFGRYARVDGAHVRTPPKLVKVHLPAGSEDAAPASAAGGGEGTLAASAAPFVRARRRQPLP